MSTPATCTTSKAARTFCPGCGAALIERDWHDILQNTLTAHGACPDCGTAIAGRFDGSTARTGRRRFPIRMRMA